MQQRYVWGHYRTGKLPEWLPEFGGRLGEAFEIMGTWQARRWEWQDGTRSLQAVRSLGKYTDAVDDPSAQWWKTARKLDLDRGSLFISPQVTRLKTTAKGEFGRKRFLSMFGIEHRVGRSRTRRKDFEPTTTTLTTKF